MNQLVRAYKIYRLNLAITAIFLALMVAGEVMAGTAVYHADVYVTVRDADGKPLENIAVDGWGGQSREYLHTDKDGKIFMQVSYQDVAGLLGAPKWPRDMAVKLRFENQNKSTDRLPRFQLLYYRFEIVPNEKKCAYNVFVSDYDYWFGETWVGTFYPPSSSKAPEFKKTVIEGNWPKTYTAIPPRKRDTYSDKNELVRGEPLTEIDLFETKLETKVIGERQLRIDLDITRAGSYQVAASLQK